MKILITGAGGFLGKYFTNWFSHYDVTALTREHLDLTDSYKICSFLKKNKFDTVIHCASQGRNTPYIIDTEMFYNNINMFTNLINNRRYFRRLINIGSGAEYDIETDIKLAHEYNVCYHVPRQSYGLSKNIINTMIEKTPSFFNIRLFGCFDVSEDKNRLFQIVKTRIQNGEKFILSKDRYFDYIWANDVAELILLIMKDECSDYNLNCVYKEKMKLSSLIRKFITTNGLDSTLFEVDGTKGLCYTGNFSLVEKYSQVFKGIEEGIKLYR